MLRDGKEMHVRYQLNLRRPLVPVLAGVDCVPSYFIVGGLVFVPLSIPFLEHAYGGEAFCLCMPMPVRLAKDVSDIDMRGAETWFGRPAEGMRCVAALARVCAAICLGVHRGCIALNDAQTTIPQRIVLAGASHNVVRVLRAGNHWRKHAPVQILALVAEYCERLDEQVVVLFQVLAAEINFGYKFQTVRIHPCEQCHAPL